MFCQVWKKRKLLAITITLVTITMALAGYASFANKVNQWEPNPGNYRSLIGLEEPKLMKFARPKWVADVVVVTDYRYPAGSVLAKDNLVWAATKNGLKAFNIKNGKVIWQQGNKEICSLARLNKAIFSLNKNRLLTAYNALNGKVMWSAVVNKKKENYALLHVEGSELYVSWDKGLIKVDPATGKILWKVDKSLPRPGVESFNGSAPIVLGKVVLQRYTETGAITHETLYAFDRVHGKELWYKGFASLPLALRDNTLYIEYTWFHVDQENIVTLKALDLFTGTVLKSVYCPLELFTGKFFTGGPRRVVISGEQVYVGLREKVIKYNLGGETPRKQGVNIGISGDIGEWTAGPVNDLFIFKRELGLSGYNRKKGTYYPFEGINNPVLSLIIQGRALIAGQSDGQIAVCDLLSGKSVFVSKVASRNFQFMQPTGKYLVIQSGEKLYVYETSAVEKIAD
ncbi:MAG TPA: hypothetical protein DHV84_05305 [Desulfotomaculum sp.]|nr:hypothetical protein [Desulfotomaculum sp.]